MPALCAVATLALGLPVAAETPPARTETGSVLLPAIAPEPAKRAYNHLGEEANGVIGHVFRLTRDADGKPYTLEKTTPLPGNADVYFYQDDDGRLGEICNPSYTEEGMVGLGNGSVLSDRETGTICPGPPEAAYALVVLFSGANVGFRLSY